MKLSRLNNEYIEIDENWLNHNYSKLEKKYHLVKINLKNPTKEKLDKIIKLLFKTNRFIVSNNITFYNLYFKKTRKKYYVENVFCDDKIISFLRKNNKILFNFSSFNINELEKVFEKYLLKDILNNVEVIKINSEMLEKYSDILNKWNGNVILI